MPVYSQKPWGVAWGKVAMTVDSGNTGTTSEATICSVTFTAVAGRCYKVTGHSRYVAGSVAADSPALRIKESSTVLRASYAVGSSIGMTHTPILIKDDFSAGSHTLDLTIIRNSGSGTVTAYGAASDGSENYILVEDIGPA